MRSPSLEYFHAKIEKLIRLAQSYTEINELSFIIKACRLKPHDYLFEKRSPNLILHRWWVDEFGNSFYIGKNKRIHITHNDLKLDRKRIVCTDLYYGLSLERVAKMSILAYLCAGKDEDLYQDCCLLTFLGVDNHLRSYLYWYGEWQQVSPLLMGMKHLKLLINNADIRFSKQFNNSQSLPIPCINGSTWLTSLPAGEDFISMLHKNHEVLLPIFKDSK